MTERNVDIRNEEDVRDLLELRPGEFVVVTVDRRARQISVNTELDYPACDTGPFEHFRRRGGGNDFQVGDIVTRVRA